MGPLGWPEIILILLVLLLVFGAKRLPEMGRSVGKGMREFKDAVSGIGDDTPTPPPTSPNSQESPAELPPASSESPASSYEVDADEKERETVP